MEKKHKMSKSFKIFLIALAISLIAFIGYKSYVWVSQGDRAIERRVEVLLSADITELEKEALNNKINDLGGKILFKNIENGSEVYDIILPWYTGLYGFKNRAEFIKDIESLPGINTTLKGLKNF